MKFFYAKLFLNDKKITTFAMWMESSFT